MKKLKISGFAGIILIIAGFYMIFIKANNITSVSVTGGTLTDESKTLAEVITTNAEVISTVNTGRMLVAIGFVLIAMNFDTHIFSQA